jgi:hypothetical protein
VAASIASTTVVQSRIKNPPARPPPAFVAPLVGADTPDLPMAM